MEESATSCVERNRQGEIILESLQDMRNKKEMLDATLASDDVTLNVHKLVLSACSSFLRKLISNNQDSHTFICLPGVKSGLLAPLLDFMYAGEVFVAPEDLSEFLELAREPQVKGLTQIAPVDTVTTAESSTVYVDIKKFYREGEDVHKKKDVELIDAQKDINQNGVETDVEPIDAQKDINKNGVQNIHVMEGATLVDTIDNNVMNTEDENYNGNNIRIEVAEFIMDGKQEDDNLDLLQKRMESQDIKLAGTEIQVENDSNALQHQAADNREAKNQTNIEKENIKAQLKYSSDTGTNVSSEQHLLICSKIAKVGVREDRRHLCKVCDKSGTKDIIYNHVAMEHVNPIPTEQEEKNMEVKMEVKIKKDKIITKKVKPEEKTSMTSKKTAAELALEWGDDEDSKSVCEKVVTPTRLVNPIDMEHINPIDMEHINPNATELFHHNEMEHINPIAMESTRLITTELVHHKEIEPANTIDTEHTNLKASTELGNNHTMDLIAMESVNPIPTENVNGIGAQYDNHVGDEKPEQPVLKIAGSQATEGGEKYTQVRKHEENEKTRIVPSKKRKTVTFSSDEPEEFIFEREEYGNTGHFKKKRFAPSDAEIVVNVNEMLNLRAGGIMSVTKEGFQFQDEPQQIEDLDNIQHKAVCKKIVMLGSNKYKCMECGKKGQKRNMLNHINKGKFN